MTVQRRLQIIRAHLQAVSRGGRLDEDTLAVWLRELDGIDDETLDARIRQARNEHADRVEMGKGWGRITPDDVLRVNRREERNTPGGQQIAPENPVCALACMRGRVSLRDPEGYDVCVRCSCFAGDWWLGTPVWGKQDNVEAFLERDGWEQLRVGVKLQEDHRQWIEARSQQVGPVDAIREYQQHIEERGSG